MYLLSTLNFCEIKPDIVDLICYLYWLTDFILIRLNNKFLLEITKQYFKTILFAEIEPCFVLSKF